MTDSSIIASMTCNPVATAMANMPSRTALPISAIATVTASGNTSSPLVPAGTVFFW